MKNKKEKEVISRDTSGINVLSSIEVDIDSLPTYRSKSHRIKIVDSSHNNILSATRES